MNNKHNVDFYTVYELAATDPRSKFDYEVKVDFAYKRVKDIVVKGSEFSGFWNGEKWSLHIDDLIDSIDNDIVVLRDKLRKEHPDAKISAPLMNFESSGIMLKFINYCKKQSGSDVQFNSKILFSDVKAKREDYSTYQLPYTPTSGETPAFDEMMSILYKPEELDKILWAMGALFTGEISKIEKFLYLYGAKGTGKGTVLNIIKLLVGDYWAAIDLQAITGSSEFATADIREVPMLIDSDSDISKIVKEQNLLKLTSHEDVLIRKLYKPAYPVRFNGLLVTASNERYKAKTIDSGINRRAIVVHPTGNKLPMKQYQVLNSQISFEIPYIAQKCIDRYYELGMDAYQNDIDVEMVEYSDKVFAFVRENELALEEGITLKRATDLYKLFLEEFDWATTGAKNTIKNGLKRYYDEFLPETTDNEGHRVRNFFKGFKRDVAFPEQAKAIDVNLETMYSIALRENTDVHIFENEAKDWPAQYTGRDGFPKQKWDVVTTTMKDIDPRELHFVRVPLQHIVIDFDLKNEAGEKDLDINLSKAALFPPTYTEVSKSGGGVHLHYWYDGDVSLLANEVEPHVEIKVFSGKSALRRKYILSNDEPIAHISTGLPLKAIPEESMYKDTKEIVWNEKKLREFVLRCLRKEHHGSTKPEIDFMFKVLNEAKDDNVEFDLSDLSEVIYKFAMSSTNQYEYCMHLFPSIPLSTIEKPEEKVWSRNEIIPDEELIFFDIEVFSNLLLVCWKQYGLVMPEDYFDRMVLSNNKYGYSFKGNKDDVNRLEQWREQHKTKFAVLFNPSTSLLEYMMTKPLVGFNNRKYDNHIVYSGYMGATTMDMYNQSQSIINNDGGTVGGAYNISYADVYEFHDIKQSLKKWEIELGIKHDESEFPWDRPLEEFNWVRVAEYCMNDVNATEAVFAHPKGQDAYTARKILCQLTDMPVNTKTQTLAEKFIFGDDPRPQDKFNWYNLAQEFPGYDFNKYRKPQSLYKGKEPSEGGYVSSKPGVYGVAPSCKDIIDGTTGRKKDIIYIDVDSMHPHSLIACNYFGPYTPKFAALVTCRMHIKNGRYEEAAHAFDDIDPTLSDKLQPYLTNPDTAKGLGHAMKIVINIIYGMTSAKYDNKFRDPRNVDNIVAKRGALFMMELEIQLTERGVDVIHVKTDSMKLTNYTDEDVQFAMDFAHQYGYNFSVECVFDRLALVNKAVLIGHIPDEEKHNGWEAVGSQYAEPFVFKKLFSNEIIEEHDFAILKSVKSSIYLGDRYIGKNAEVYASKTGVDCMASREVNIAAQIQSRMLKPIEKLLPKRDYAEKVGKEWIPLPKDIVQQNIFNKISSELDYPIKEVKAIVNAGYPDTIIEKFNSVTGTKGHKWRLWSEYQGVEDVDFTYYTDLVRDAINDIYSVGDGDIIFEGTPYSDKSYEINLSNKSQELQGL